VCACGHTDHTRCLLSAVPAYRYRSSCFHLSGSSMQAYHPATLALRWLCFSSVSTLRGFIAPIIDVVHANTLLQELHTAAAAAAVVTVAATATAAAVTVAAAVVYALTAALTGSRDCASSAHHLY
jgi:branched-subunit amino acid transport protein